MFSQMLERIAGSSLVYAGIARGMVFIAMAIIVWAVFDRLARSAMGARRRRCPKCRYSLDGLAARDDRLLCPECGRACPVRCTGFFERLEWKPRWRAMAAGALLLAGASASWWWFTRPAPAPPPLAQQPPPRMIHQFIHSGPVRGTN